MKKLMPLIILLGLFFIIPRGFSQFNQVKQFDYNILKDKKLYIPTYEASKSYLKKMTKKGKFDKINDAKAKAEHYNTIWKEAMAESSYDATDYEIRAFDRKKIIKSKNREAILLYYVEDKYHNWTAVLMVTYPKKQVIARVPITGLDLGYKNDVRFMMNMLNESMETACKLEEEGDKSYSNMRKQYKEDVVEFYKSLKDKTFLVPKSEHEKPKKAAEKNAELEEVLKSWTLSKYELTTQEEIEKRRVDGDPDSFYWRDFPIYTKSPFITYHFNVIVSTQGDDLLIGFLGKRKMKPATVEKVQNKILSKAKKYMKQIDED